MGRRKRYSITSPVRYKLKMYRTVASGVHPDLAKAYAEAVTLSQMMGWSLYYHSRRRVMASPVWHKIPWALRGLYLAFTDEVVKNTWGDGRKPLGEIVEKWVKGGLDRELLVEVIRALGLKPPEGDHSTGARPEGGEVGGGKQ